MTTYDQWKTQSDREGVDDRPKRWDDPAFWENIRVDHCEKCHKGHVLRNGLCWNCRKVTP